MDDSAGLASLVQHRHRVEVGLAAEQLQHLCGGGALRHRRLLVEQRGQVAAVVVQYLYLAARAAEHLLDVP
ncbi:hypothetical protein D9M71_594470 [compost metagenome]